MADCTDKIEKTEEQKKNEEVKTESNHTIIYSYILNGRFWPKTYDHRNNPQQ